ERERWSKPGERNSTNRAREQCERHSVRNDTGSQQRNDAAHGGAYGTRKGRRGHSGRADVKGDSDEVGDRDHGVAPIYSADELYGMTPAPSEIVGASSRAWSRRDEQACPPRSSDVSPR